jgi:hypothetical protein
MAKFWLDTTKSYRIGALGQSADSYTFSTTHMIKMEMGY